MNQRERERGDKSSTREKKKKKDEQKHTNVGQRLKGIKVKIRGVKISFPLILYLFHSNEFTSELMGQICNLGKSCKFLGWYGKL